jgi:long-chain acyl-CoA synthetase
MQNAITANVLEREYETMLHWFQGRKPPAAWSPSLRRNEQHTLETRAKKQKMVGLYSSGSTGNPRFMWRDKEDLEKDCSSQDCIKGWTWATCYAPWTFAGTHLACQAGRSGGRVIHLSNEWTSNQLRLNHLQPEAIAATPTFMDLLIRTREKSIPSEWQPRQITLGGEILKTTTGRRILAAFPGSRLTVIYARAETGILAKTDRADGWYPLSSLEKRCSSWKLVDHTLHIQRNSAWINCMDLCEVKDQHFRVFGRSNRLIQIGGEMVSLDQVETIAESHPEVRYACATSKSNPIVGQVIALTIEVTGSNHTQELEEHVLRYLRGRLPKPAWPRWIQWGPLPELKHGKRTAPSNTKRI